MPSLFQQIRVRLYGIGQEDSRELVGSIKDKRIPAQRTQSFKREKQRGRNWFKRQISRQMSQDYDSDGYVERATAVAAAAYAINALKESKQSGEAPKPSLTRFKSKKDDVIIPGPESDHESTWETAKYDFISDDEISEEDSYYAKVAPEKSVNVPAPSSIIKPPRFAPKTPPRESGSHSIDHDGDMRMPEKAVARAPSFKRTSTFPSKRFDGTASSKSEIEAPKQDMPTLNVPESSAPKTDYMPPTIKPRTRPGMEETKADAWEKAELAKINERYDKVKTTIQKWEDKKREEAKRKLNERESELEQTRVKARQRYHSAIESINQIAGGAKAQAEERRRNEEMKAKEKANVIRTTGEVPKTCCFCF